MHDNSESTPSPQRDAFLFVCCQPGAESALKSEIAQAWPTFRFAYSRPGFVTFKTGKQTLPDHLDLKSVFATTYGLSLGRIDGDQPLADRAAKLWESFSDERIDLVHVWERQRQVPGDYGYEPGETEIARQVATALMETAGERKLSEANRPGKVGQRVLDCIVLEPDSWWFGVHRVERFSSRYPGGVMPIVVPENSVSRAYRKMVEALEWSRFPIEAGDECVEIGSSPGGSCQALLDRGFRVTGIDPAEMAEVVLQHPNFTHVRARGADLKRREFSSFRWLMADSNVAPKHTLDTVEHIVTNRRVRTRGMLLTLKLLQWKLADEIPSYLQRIRSWGFELVKARQLAFNRQEICVAALRRKSMLREPKKRARPIVKSQTDS